MSSKAIAKTLNTHPKPKRVEVVVNPAPSRKIPLLAILNHAFRKAGIAWDISITHGDGDGHMHAKNAVESGADVVAVYGGDGTVVEVASAMIGSKVPLLILGGGTGNLVAAELRLSTNLEKNCKLICRNEFKSRDIDVGMMGERPFLLRAGCGIEPEVVQNASREQKDRHGKWAYIFATMKTLQDWPVADYEIILDDERTIRERGVACVVANAGTVGLGRLTLSPSVNIEDGLLDVFFLKKVNLDAITQLAGKMTGLDKLKIAEFAIDLLKSKKITHWTVKSAEIHTNPVLDIQVDGDVVTTTPQRFEALPSALRVVV